MADAIPLKVASGQVQQFASTDTLKAENLPAGIGAFCSGFYIDACYYSFMPTEVSPGTYGGSITPTAGRLVGWKLMVYETVQVDAALTYIRTAGGTGARVNAGIYALSAGRPSGAPLLSTGEIDVTSQGYKTPSITATTLDPGGYMAVWWTNDTTVRVQSVDPTQTGAVWPIGNDSTSTLSPGLSVFSDATSYQASMPTLTASNFGPTVTTVPPLWIKWRVQV